MQLQMTPPTRVAWLTDIHLDFLDGGRIAAFSAEVSRARPDAVVITGDISVARRLGPDLHRLAAGWRVPAYFVAGNHDYYGAGIANVRRAMRELEKHEPRLRWLPSHGVVRLSDTTALVGVDGWADGRLGDPDNTPIELNDHVRIADLVQPTRQGLLSVVRRLGDDEAATLERLLGEALPGHEHVLVATHVPPFREAATHEGKISGDDWLPWMTCHAVGLALRRMARAFPERRITVLAGHTHDRARVRVEENLEVWTGAAEYGDPAIEEVLELR